MGIIGLESLLAQNIDKFANKIKLQNTNLIIDCNNLQRFLLDRRFYKNNHNLRADKYGYSFKDYARITRNFFENLLQCGITPILVVDGSASGKGHFTGLNESKELMLELRGQESVSEVKESNDNPAESTAFLTPRLHQIVFREIARKLGIEIHQVAYEANNLIVRLANELNCPVLSGDTDCIIFNINRGFILMRSYRYNRTDNDFIECYAFKQDLFVAAFPGLNVDCLPMLNVLQGKHSNKMKTFEKIVDLISEQPDSGADIKITSDLSKRVAQILFWLIGKTREEVQASILASIEDEKRHEAEQFCHKLLNVYNYERTSEIETELEKIYPPDKQVRGREPPSKYLARLFSNYDLTGPCMNIILGHSDHDTSFLSDLSKPSPYEVEFRAFSVAMALLRPKSIDQMRADGSTNEQVFHVYTRKVNEENEPDYGRFEIRPMEHLNRFGSLNQLDCYSMIALPRYKKTRIIDETFRHQAQVKQQLTSLISELFYMTPRGTGKKGMTDVCQETIECMMLVRYISLETESPLDETFVAALLLMLLSWAFKRRVVNQRLLPLGTCIQLGNLIETPDFSNEKFNQLNESEVYLNIMHKNLTLQAAYHAHIMLNNILDNSCHNLRPDLWFDGLLLYRIMIIMIRDGMETFLQCSPKFQKITSQVLDCLQGSVAD